MLTNCTSFMIMQSTRIAIWWGIHHPSILQEAQTNLKRSKYQHMGWLRLVGSLKLQVSFAEYSLFYRALLQKRPIILRSLLIVATPYLRIVGQQRMCVLFQHTRALSHYSRATQQMGTLAFSHLREGCQIVLPKPLFLLPPPPLTLQASWFREVKGGKGGKGGMMWSCGWMGETF